MTIMVSGHFLQSGRVGGAEHMFYNLVRGLWANDVGVTLLCTAASRLDPHFLAELRRRQTPLAAVPSFGKRFIAEQASCLDPRLRADAILFPNYFTPPAIPRRLGRIVTVIHDFQYRSFPEITPRARRLWLKLAHRLTFARADRVIVPSEFVLRAVRELYGPGALAKSVVIPNPVSWGRFGGDDPASIEASATADDLVARPYVLSVAAHYPHKNLTVLIRAFATLRDRHPELRLVLVGQRPAALLGVRDRADRIGALIRELALEDAVIATGYLDDRRLGDLYRNAELFALPSLFEGFGMPAVEALGFGLPTITTRCGALPEVTRGRAIYLDRPEDAREWADKMAEVLHAPGRFRLDGSAIAELRRHYAPERIARRYAAALLGA